MKAKVNNKIINLSVSPPMKIGFVDEINKEDYYTKEQVLKLLNFSNMRLHRLRKAKLFPPPIYKKENGMYNRPLKALYLKRDIEDWLSKNNQTPKI